MLAEDILVISAILTPAVFANTLRTLGVPFLASHETHLPNPHTPRLSDTGRKTFVGCTLRTSPQPFHCHVTTMTVGMLSLPTTIHATNNVELV
jgi:hypothetical protein